LKALTTPTLCEPRYAIIPSRLVATLGNRLTPGFKTNVLEPAFTSGFEIHSDENSGPFALTPMQLGADATASSQRLDWTILKFTDFEVTAFGY
jgi:hypothetical protein